MKRARFDKLVPRVAVLLSMLACGTLLSVAFVPRAVFDKIHSGLILSVWQIVSVLAVPIAFVLGSRLLDRFERSQQRLDRDLLDTFLRYIPDNVFFKDRDSRFVRISHSMASYIGLASPEEAIDRTDAEFFSHEHAEQALADEREIMRTGEPVLGKEEKETWPDGRETWVLTTKVAMKDADGQVIGTMGIAHDISDRKQGELNLQRVALHDPLTGLPNRLLFEERLSQAMVQSGRSDRHAAVLLLDIDRFKYINDSFGHHIGDRLLEALATRLKQCVRDTDIVARLGGDEFGLAISMLPSGEDAEGVAKKVLSALAEPFQIEKHELRLSASIGICLFPDNASSADLLLQYAEDAMYEGKKRGRGQYCYFSQALTEATQYRQKLESDLLHASERDEFVLYYQPFVDSQSGNITGVETLLRWQHPQLGLISPNQFIPELEELGLMVGVGNWVLRSACRQAVDWQRLGVPQTRIAVNVSSQQFYHGNIVATVAAALQETKLKPELLELELTESQTLDSSEATVNIMRNLKKLGVKLSLDDFGTGWSSLSYLRHFPIDRLKIDRSFVRDIDTQPAAEAVVKSILGLGRSLGIACVAEGVETRQQRDYFKKQACREMQGFLFSRPVPAVEMTQLLREGKFDLNRKVPAAAENAGVTVAPTAPRERTFDGEKSWVQ
jgi:diguanylate cyclase (GGDEF)-like protein/PAS domain S-box-containing protein